MDNNDILNEAKKLNINNNMVKLFCNYIDLKNSKWNLRSFHYNTTRQEIVATDGHKLIIVNNKCELVKDYISFFEDMKKDITNINDNQDLLFNLEFYLKYNKLCNLYYKVQETKNSYNLIAVKDNHIIASEPDLQATYPDYSCAIDYISYNTQAKINVPLMLKTLKDITNEIKEHNKLCKLKKDKISTINEKTVLIDLVFNDNDLKVILSEETEKTNLNISLININKFTSYTCKFNTSINEPIKDRRYRVNLKLFIDILTGFNQLKEHEIMLHFNLEGLRPIKITPLNIYTQDIVSYLMPCKILK